MAEGLPARSARWPLVGRSDELADLAAALEDRTRGGVLVLGGAGVGKTRLADEFLTLVEQAGRACGRATASATAGTVPLGALAHLLPPGVGCSRSDAVALFDCVLGAFRTTDEQPFVLLVDDLHLLDCTSLMLLTQLIDARAAFLIGTVRTGEPVPEAFSALWRGDRMLRIDVTELSCDGVERLLCAVLGGPVESRTCAEVHTASRGNPLFVRELVQGSLSSGRLVAEQGLWRLTGPLVSTTPLAELVEAHIGAAEPAERSVLDLLAAVGQVGLGELTGGVPMDSLERLEHNGLVTVRTAGRRIEVSLAHPLYGEVLRSQMPVLTRRRLLLEHADRVLRTGARRPGDALRIATWRLDAAGTADPELLLAAARMARYGHDFAAVRRLATAVLAQRASAEAQLLLGEALYELGRFAEAEAALADGEALATDEQDLVPIIATRVRNLTWGLLDASEGLRVSAAARTRIISRAGTQELLAVEARVRVYAGQPSAALHTLSLLDTNTNTNTDLRTAVLTAVPRALALVLLGRCESGLAVARQGLADHARLGDQLAIVHPVTHLAIEVQALTDAGRLTEAGERATDGRKRAAQDRSTIGRIWFAYHLGRCALLGGRPATAHRWYAEAVALCRDNDYPWPRRLVLSALATAAAVRGDAAGARQALAEAAELPDIGYLRNEQELGRAWTAVAAGDLAEARRVLRAAADNAAAGEQFGSEALLRHDLVRLGDPGGECDRLADLTRHSEGELVGAYAAHARAAAAGDPEQLTATSTRFERLGMMLYAAETALAAGRAYRRHGRPRQATREDSRAAALIAHCEGAHTPGLLTSATPVPLTRRESEVAVLAANGATSKEIAFTLHLSARTVDNHLRSVYTKLGVTRRAELPTALTNPPAG